MNPHIKNDYTNPDTDLKVGGNELYWDTFVNLYENMDSSAHKIREDLVDFAKKSNATVFGAFEDDLWFWFRFNTQKDRLSFMLKYGK
jgi:hypothetical protein